MQTEFVGDNISFMAVDIGDYTIYLNKTGTDSATEKFASANPTSGRRIDITADKAFKVVGQNGVSWTNPRTLAADKSYVEKRDVPFISQVVVRTTVANSFVQVRWN